MWWASLIATGATFLIGTGLAMLGNWQSHVIKERRWLARRIFKARAAHGHEKAEPDCLGCQMADELLRDIHVG